MDIEGGLLQPGPELDPESPAGRALAAQLAALFQRMKEDFASGAARRRFAAAEGLRPAINPKDPFLGSMCLGLTLGDEGDPCSLAFLSRRPEDFFVTLKSDGVRYLLVHTRGEGIYLVSRGNQLFEMTPDASPTIDSVFDGELVPGLQEARPCFLLFDAVLFRRSLFFDRNYSERLEACERFERQRRFAGSFAARPPLRLYTKDFFPLAQTAFVLQKLARHPRFEGHTDGLVFARQHYPYLPGRSPGNLKWKPEELNTIDFLLAPNPGYASALATSEMVVELYVLQQEGPLLYDFAFFAQEEDKARVAGVVGGGQPIIAEMCWDRNECSHSMRQFVERWWDYDSACVQRLIANSLLSAKDQQSAHAIYTLFNNFDRRMGAGGKGPCGGWRLVRLRPDKQIPNALSTADKVLLSVHEEAISGDTLLSTLVRAAS